MSLINCPECGNDVSTAAVACPNCGHPLSAPAFESKTVVREAPPVVTEKETFPKWVLAPLIIIGALLIFLLFAMFRSADDDQARNINVDIRARQQAERDERKTETETREVTVPTAPAVPQDIPPQTESNVTISENPDSPVSDIAAVTLEARVSNAAGSIQPVRKEKFYLLDEDLETILRDAEIEDTTGQGLVNAFGLSVLFPERYRETNRRALAEINKHIVYDVLTDSNGRAQIKNVRPGSYNLFGITKTRNGFAVWNSPVSVKPGENILNLSPQRLTEIQE